MGRKRKDALVDEVLTTETNVLEVELEENEPAVEPMEPTLFSIDTEETPVTEVKPKRKRKKNTTEVPVVETESVVETEPVVEEVTPKRRKKKLNSDEIVEEIIKKNNLEVHEVEEMPDEFLTIVEENNPKKKKTKSKKETQEDLRRKELELEEKILSEETAAYVQIVKDKHNKKKKIIRYNTNVEKGLSSEIVEYRKLQNLCNTKSVGSTKTIPQIVFSNIFTFFNLLNFSIATWIIATLGLDAWRYIFFIIIVSTNIIISIVQEIRSKKIIDKLSVMSAPNATVLRDSVSYEIPVTEVVLDDILCLSSGKQIASDSIVVEGNIEVNESLLTGESEAISKKPGDVLYAGSFVVSGNCKARVERVGKDNYIEKLTGQAKKYRKPKSDLLKTLTNIIRFIAVLIIPLGTLVFMSQYSGAGWVGTQDYVASVIQTSGAVVGMIPSGLFLLTSISLAVGVIRLAQNNTLVQELYCIEMLARVDVLCLDKTGTITDGSMAVKSVIEYPNSTGVTVKNAYAAMQNALNETNVTSKALEEKFGRAKRIKHKATIPFSSARKFSAVEFERYGTFILGAPEFVLTKNYHMVSADVNKAANGGYRVICLAHSDGAIEDGKVTGEITPIALILIEDTIRPDAIETINYFKQSGVEVKVISGDNPITVSKISERAGIDNADQYISLEGLSDKEVIRAASKYTVFGRVSPAQKKLLIMTLKELGKTVAMTGDGVNDILALREADCSISLASGSDAAKNVSHLVLLDSNFGSMPKVVAEGRRVINNVQHIASLFLTKTIFSFLLAIYCIISAEHKYPIQPNQLMIIDLCVTGIPSFILALEANNNQVKGKFFFNVVKNALPGALTIVITTAAVFLISTLPGFQISSEEVTTIIVLNATFTCFMVLFKVCRPFNILRRILFFCMATLAILLVIFIPNMFDIVEILPIRFSHLPDDTHMMGIHGGLLLLCLIQATYPIMRILENIKTWLKGFADFFVRLLRKIK